MGKQIIYFSLVFILSIFSVSAQESGGVDPMPIRLKGRILGVGDNIPVAYAHIINNRTHGGTISNAEGLFTMEMMNIDSLVILSMGFLKEDFKVPYNYNNDSMVTFYLRPVSIALRQVDVTGDKPKVNMDGVPVGNPVDIDPKLRGDAYNERPPAIAALFNPLSFWYYYISKREIRKRNVREAMLIEKNWELHSQNYNKEVVKSLTGLNDQQSDEFMIWFNSLNILPYTSTEYEVRSSIRKYFEIYKSEGRLK